MDIMPLFGQYLSKIMPGFISLLYPGLLLLIIPVALLIIILVVRNFVKFSTQIEKKEFLKKRRIDKAFLIISRILMFSLLIIALASPYELMQIREKGDPSLKILVDRSGSFGLFDQDIDKMVKERIGDKIPVTIVEMAPGNRSALGSAIRNNMQGDDNLLIITDAYNNEGWDLGDAMLFAKSQRTVVNALDIKPKFSDLAVIVAGPSQVLQDTENEFFVTVNRVGEARGKLTVTLDGQEIISQDISSEKTLSFKQKFADGDHRIIAKIDSNDYFAQNNIFYKTMHVVPKPKILFLTRESSPLKTISEGIYDVTFVNRLPGNLDGYHLMIIDNIREDEIQGDVTRIKDYLEKGNGLMVVGGQSMFEYNDKCNPKKANVVQTCLLHSLLPANIGYGAAEDFKNVNVILVIDVSGSTGDQFSNTKQDEKIAVQKALAIELLKYMKLDYKVGVVVFNSYYAVVNPLEPLFDHPELNSTIARLKFGGGTVAFQGLRKAQDLLANAAGSKNVILISDGLTLFPQDALNKAQEMAKDGITVYAVGVGQDTDANFMQALADNGNGVFFQPSDMQKLKIVFDQGAEEESNRFNVQVLNRNTFITKGLTLDGYATGLNQVVPKGTGRVLISTEKNSPILTTWRFGLGRVALLSTDNGNKWAGPLYSGKNSLMMTRTINWVAGDPNRVKDYSISVSDTYLGEPTDIIVMSDKTPSLQGYEFSKVEMGEKDLYTATFNPKTTGIFQFQDTIAAVNYPLEYQRLGLNPELKGLVQSSNGGFFTLEEVDKLVEKVKNDSVRTRTDYKYYRWPFIIAALLLLLIEILVRRLRQNYLQSQS